MAKTYMDLERIASSDGRFYIAEDNLLAFLTRQAELYDQYEDEAYAKGLTLSTYRNNGAAKAMRTLRDTLEKD